MDAEGLVTVALALVCAVGVGMAATTLDSSVDTTPNDVIDVDESGLPMGSGQVDRYRERLQSDSASKPGDSGQQVTATTHAEDGSPSQASEASDRGDAGAAEQPTPTPDQGQGPGPDPDPQQSLLQWLLSLLRALLEFLLSVLPLLALVAAAAALAYHRDRVRSVLSRLGDDGDDDRPGAELRAAPTNDVARAWHEMVATLGVERPETKTPRQCARAAVEAGGDRDAVEGLTGLFEEVRYGDAEVTDERRQRARDGLERVRSRHGGTS
jgi:hypothetical protein